MRATKYMFRIVMRMLFVHFVAGQHLVPRQHQEVHGGVYRWAISPDEALHRNRSTNLDICS